MSPPATPCTWHSPAAAHSRPDFIDALTVAEESGRIVESMERLSNRYEEEAEAAMRTLASVFGFLIGAVVMALIVLLIFRLFGFYLGTINDALHMAH